MHQKVEEEKKNSILRDINNIIGSSAVEAPDLSDLARSAYQGRIEHIFVDSNWRMWGQTDPYQGVIRLSSEQQDHKDDCVLDDVIQEVIRFDGQVSFFEEGMGDEGKPYFVKYRW
jgi:hypothetical protein